MSVPQLHIEDSESVTARSTKRKLNSLARDIYGTSTSGKKASDDAGHSPIFQARLERARQAWTQFREVWDNLDKAYVKAGEDSKFPTDHDRLFYTAITDEMDFSNGYAIIVEKSEHSVQSGTDPHASYMNHSVSRHLPRITLPSFNGDLMSWKSFSDTFKTLVHDDPNLTRIEKFNYLKNSLKGEASTLIIKLSVTDENYDQAWQILQSAYANPRVLATHYIWQALEYRSHSSKPSLETYQSYLSGVVDNIESFKALQLKDPTDFLLTLISLRALDPETRREFELAYLETELPIVDDVFGYIRNRMKALKLSSDRDGHNWSRGSNPDSQWKASKQMFPNRSSVKYSGSSFHTSSTPRAGSSGAGSGWQRRRMPSKEKRPCTKPCSFCQLDHELYRCYKFAELTLQKRSDFIRAWKGCVNCLREGHGVKECNSKFTCKYCQRRHHSLLHEGDGNHDKPASASPSSGSNFHAKQNMSAPSSRLVLFGTAQVIIRSSSGTVLMARAALDSCSQYTFISNSLAERLKCNILNTFEGGLTGLGDVSLNRPSGVTDCSIFGSGIEFPVDAVVTDAITARMPSNSVPNRIIREVTSHILADPLFGHPAPIDILIGGDIYPQLLVGAPIKTIQSGIYLLPTVFGLVVTGSIVTKESSGGQAMMISNAAPKLEDMMKSFWELEEPELHARDSPEVSYCRQHFEENTSRLGKLPIKPDSEPCGNNGELAARLISTVDVPGCNSTKNLGFTDSMVVLAQQSWLPRGVCDAKSDRAPFKGLSPFTGEDGVVRVGGRLKEAPTSPAPEIMDDRSINPTTRWANVKRQIDHVWSRWRLEYLHHLQQKTKWTRPSGDLRVGDLVILVEKRHVPGHWPVARVIETHPGSDLAVRVVSVRMSTGAIFKRSVNKLAPLFYPNL